MRRTFNFLFSPPALKSSPSPSLVPPFVASSQSKLIFFPSVSDRFSRSKFTQTSNTTSPVEVDDTSKVELKEQIENFLQSEEGNEEAISSIFETILKRKLSGKHEESDNELMDELREKPVTDFMEDPREFGDQSDEDVDSFSDEEEDN
ncbi:uncharacterized protein LOC110823516 [Carica papaya]|uniref:uncharacterized protein LOC110823516 n=1 Tax=Carica papaya TaxID=3649 RepID=UPI000B8D0AD1|nr:uncharacterized protein LOC110823516 [Carica papaya]